MSAAQGLGLGSAVVGNELQGWAALLDKWQMRKVFEQEQRIQNQYKESALGPQGPFETGVRQSSFGNVQNMLDQATAARQAAYQKIAGVPLGGGFNKQSNYNPSADSAYTSMLGGFRANLGSYSDWAFQQAINNLRNQQALNQTINYAGGQAQNVYPLEMYGAQHAYDWLSALGQSISSLGGAASNYLQMNQPPAGQQYSQPIGPVINQPPVPTYTDIPASPYGGGWNTLPFGGYGSQGQLPGYIPGY